MIATICDDASVTVYALSDPRNACVPVYIGATASPLHRRYAQHIMPSAKNRVPGRWIERLKQEGQLPRLFAIRTVRAQMAKQVETEAIRKFNSISPLINGKSTSEGNAARFHTAESRAKMSEKRKGCRPSIAAKQASLKVMSKRIICVETGEIFESSSAAGRKIGCHSSNIGRAASGHTKTKTIGGFHWRWA